MNTKKMRKILLVSLVIVLAASICGCKTVQSVTRDVARIAEFTGEIYEVVDAAQIADESDAEELEARVAELLHPDSGFTVETIAEKALEDEDLKDIDLEELAKGGYSIGAFSEPKMKLNDPKLGGNVYELTVDVTVGGVAFAVTLDLLSDDVALGLYDFDIDVKD